MERQGKKIIIAITKSNFGGAQKYVYTLAKNLKHRGFEVKVLVGGKGILINKLQEENIEIIKIKSLQRDVSWKKDLQVFKEIKEILKKEKPDVFHINSSKIGALGSLASKLSGIKKTVFTVHGFAFNENRSKLAKSILAFIYWLIFALSNKNIFVSQTTLNQAPKKFLSKDKFEVIYNGVEIIDFYEKEKARNLLQLPNGRTIVGTLAELHPIKRIDKLIKAAETIDADFVVLGEGEEREKLEKIIKSKNLEKKFHLKGFVDDAAKYLKAFDVFTLVSDSEAMPLSIIEAMQANLPIVASNVGGIHEMIPENYLFNNQKELEEKILENIDLKTNYNLSNFSVDKMIDKTIETYLNS